MPDPIRPDPAISPTSARPDAVRAVSDRLLVRTSARRGLPAVPAVAPEGRSVPVVESPLPASIGAQAEAASSHSHAIDPPAESAATSTDAGPSPAVPAGAAPAATDLVAAGFLAAARPACPVGSNDQAGRLVARGVADEPIARPPAVSGRSVGDPPGLAPFDRPEPVPSDEGSLLPSPPASVPARTPFALGPDSADGGEGGNPGPNRDASPATIDDLPRVRPQRPEALAGGIADLGPARSTSAPGGSDSLSGSVPTDEEVFAAATGGSPAGGSGGGSGPTGMDLSRTNELLQQIVDAIRKQAAASSSLLPSGGVDVYAERY